MTIDDFYKWILKRDKKRKNPIEIELNKKKR